MQLLITAFTLLCLTNVFGQNLKLFDVKLKYLKFKLYTKEKPNLGALLFPGQLDGIKIDASKPFKVIIHGYTDDAEQPWLHAIKDAYFSKADCNVIGVDWSFYSSIINIYPLAARNTKGVGKHLADLFIDLNKIAKVPLENFHCIGHSLGAHVCGFAGKNVIRMKRTKIGRITAMDAAGPNFNVADLSERLAHTDANFVDAIHTDGSKYGYRDPIAMVDFYPNGGEAPQPGCVFFAIADFVSCSHARAYYLLTESIKSSGFIGHQCPNIKEYNNKNCKSNPTAIMGDNCDVKSRGVYYLNTNENYPFAKNGNV